jgi:DNA-binding beta-propeller fold protein YncE
MNLLPHLALGLLLAHPAGAVDYLLVAQPATNSILRFNAQTGAAMGPLVASGSGGLVSPRGMALGPDGNLYVADAGSSRVKRYSLVNGSPVGTDGNITPADSVLPVALKFDTNGELLVLGSSTQRSVRRYDGNTGVHLGNAAFGNSAQISNGTDFLRMQNLEILILSGLNRGSRFSSTTTTFVSHFLNSTSDLNVMNQPRAILSGPDGNYWVTNRGSNRITRYDATTGAKLNDVVDGAPLNGPAGLIISGD